MLSHLLALSQLQPFYSIQFSMCSLKLRQLWSPGLWSDDEAFFREKTSHLISKACESRIPIGHLMHRRFELDTEAFSERRTLVDPPPACFPTITPTLSRPEGVTCPLPNNSYSPTSRAVSPTVPLNQGDNVTLFNSFISDTKMYPISATDFQRYERNIIRRKHYNLHYHIRAKTTSFSRKSMPPGWTSLIHPEGAPFFYHETRHIFTDADLYDISVYTALEEFARNIEFRIQSFPVQLPERFDIVLDLRLEHPGRYNCGYYFANHDNSTLFWLDDHDVSGILSEVNVQYTSSHVGYEIESQYWYHCELFPNTRVITKDVLFELKDILTYSIGDSLTSSVSNAPYSVKELKHMLHLVNEMKDQVGRTSPGSVCTLSRLMSTFSHERFLNLHGEPGARLCRDQSVYNDDLLKQTSIFRCIDPAMFYIPSIHLRMLRDTAVDHLVNKSRSAQILTQLKLEWRDSTIYSTLLLNANVIFFATRNGPNPQSLSQRITQASTLASVGSLIVGLLLSKQSFNGKFNHFLAQRSICSFGLEALAMMYSLPNTLLLWGAISFFVALGITCVEASDIISCSLIGVAWMALIWVFVWCISTSSESGSYVKPWIMRKWLDRNSDNLSEENETWDGKSCSDQCH
ncbi:hypothetical protein BDZ94DRAFT_1247980 [Collybia nuda]|uniref:Uncharacterized protein n=1 Tax=Collybia nuda TaxID=64659 RepID=A0A9P5YFT7_9AGAR|nr:hypothetical protein BDZ94DRAFT_1247980 [Collybia nuda]